MLLGIVSHLVSPKENKRLLLERGEITHRATKEYLYWGLLQDKVLSIA